VLVKQRDALEETLQVAPLALNNLYLAYNPDAGTLDTNANFGKLVDGIVSSPSTFLCGLVEQGTNGNAQPLCNLLTTILPRGQALGQGTGTSYGSPHDASLGGLVEVDR